MTVTVRYRLYHDDPGGAPGWVLEQHDPRQGIARHSDIIGWPTDPDDPPDEPDQDVWDEVLERCPELGPWWSEPWERHITGRQYELRLEVDTVDTLADELDVTAESVQTLVDQLGELDGADQVVDAAGGILPDAAKTIREQLSQQAEARDTWLMVRGAQNLAASVRQREADLQDAIDHRDEAIREAHRRGARVTDLAQAADLHRTHVHRIIRDG